MAFLALIDDMALGQGILSCPIKATWAVLTNDPADGTLVEDVCWRAVGDRASVAGAICSPGTGEALGDASTGSGAQCCPS